MLFGGKKFDLDAIFNAFAIADSNVQQTHISLGFDFGPVAGKHTIQYAARHAELVHLKDPKTNTDSLSFAITTLGSQNSEGELIALREISFKRDKDGQAKSIQFITYTPDGSVRSKGIKGLDEFLSKTKEYLDHFKAVAKTDPMLLGMRTSGVPAGLPISYALPRTEGTNFWKDPNVKTPVC